MLAMKVGIPHVRTVWCIFIFFRQLNAEHSLKAARGLQKYVPAFCSE
jgi:hypothetical protein